ncbi:MAG: PDZ domain-containing protein [Chloroflexi bacterium]|nr:PDZ domain-containing protein [Chloroflexota bacterium]
MSNRGVILLAIGMLILGLVVGGLVGSVGGYFAGRNTAFAFNPFMQGYGSPMQPGQLPFNPPGGFQQQPATTDGARVTQVENGSPAAKAGLQVGDVITAVGGTKVDANHALADLIAAKKPGDKVDLSVTRGTQSLTLTVELGAAPQNSSTAYLGIRYGAVAPGRFRQPGSQNNNLPGG